jgi:hypothetical protein
MWYDQFRDIQNTACNMLHNTSLGLVSFDLDDDLNCCIFLDLLMMGMKKNRRLTNGQRELQFNSNIYGPFNVK